MDTEMQRLLVQTRALAFGTNIGLGKLFRPLLSSGRRIFLLHHLDVLHNPFISYKVIGRGMNQGALYLDTLIRAIEYFVYRIIRHILDRRLDRKIIFFKQRLYLPENHGIFIFAQRHDGSFVNGKIPVGNHFVHINQIHIPQPLTTGASSLRRVKRKIMRSRFFIRQSGNRTHQPLAVMAHLPGIGVINHNQPLTLLHGSGNALFQPFVILFRYDQLIYHNFYIMIFITVQLHAVYNLAHLAVHADIQITFLAHLLEKFFVMSLTGTYQRGKHKYLLTLIIPVNQADDLFLGIFHHFLSRKIRISNSCTGIEQTEIIVYLCRSPHGRAGILVCRFLFDGNYRAESCNLIHIRPLQPSQEITGVCGKGLNVSPLPFGEDGIECQGRFTASAQSGYHRQAVPWNFNIYIFQVMYTGTVYINQFFFFTHSLLTLRNLCKINASRRNI